MPKDTPSPETKPPKDKHTKKDGKGTSPENGRGLSEIDERVLYTELLQKRGLERHREIRIAALKQLGKDIERRINELNDSKNAISDPHEKIKIEIKIQALQNILNVITTKLEILTKTSIEGSEKPNITGEDVEEITFLRETISSMEERLTGVQPELINELKSKSWSRLIKFMRERKKLLENIELNENQIEVLYEIYRETPIDQGSVRLEILRQIDTIEAEIKKLKSELKDLTFENPEGFLANALLRIRELKSQLSSEIVETEEVTKIKEAAINRLREKRIIALVGETGTGKTRLAIKIAQELSGDYEFVPCHKYTTREDLFGSLGIVVKEVKPESIPDLQEAAIKAYYTQKGVSPEDLPSHIRQEIEESIKDVVKRQASYRMMETEFIPAGVLKAAEEGKIVILDEFNFLPPEVLSGLNALIEAKRGQKVSIAGREIEVKPGFGVILTGNLTQAAVERYIGRQKLDAAFVGRLNSGLIEYKSLPQANVSFVESVISQEDYERGKIIPPRDLFQVAIAILADERGNISGPSNLLEQAWNLSVEFGFLQRVYAGEETAKLLGGADVILHKYPISMRTFRDVLEHWRRDNFRYSLDWYIYETLIRPASLIDPSEAGKIFLLLKGRGLFFVHSKWNELIEVNPTNYNLKIKGEINKELFRVEKEIYFFTPQEVAEAFMGMKMPELKESEVVQRRLVDKERMERYVELKRRFEAVRDVIENWEEWKRSVELYCEDEKKILGSS
jgi:MoxR-like ATPase